MKLQRIILLSFLSLSVISCSNGKTYDDEVKANIINQLLNNVYVKAHCTQDLVYPEGYEPYNTHNEYDFERQYSLVYENPDDENPTPAVRQLRAGTPISYYQGEDGKALIEVLNNDNEVEYIPLLSNNLYVTYAKTFANPFDYIDVSDINDNLTINTSKASFILKHYFPSLQMNVSKAKFIYDETLEIATGIEMVISDKDMVLPLYDGTNLISKLKSTVTISYDYNVQPIFNLEPNTVVDENISTALTSARTLNYTVELRSDSLTSDASLFVTEDYIYLHNDIEANHMSNGDILYKKNTNNSYYTQYTYSASSNKFSKGSPIVNLNKIAPNFSTIKGELFEKDSDGVYTLGYAEAKLNAELLLIPSFNLFPSASLMAYVTLDDNSNFENISVTIDSSTVTVINEHIYNYGTTTLPNYVNLTLIN